jgi:Spy/CpxP family protein refolding chaperone
MKKLIALIIISLFCIQLVPAVSFAADKSAKPAKAATQEEPKKEFKSIFDYKTQLGLTDKQVEDMKALVAKLQTMLNEKGKVLLDMRNDLAKMIRDRDALNNIKAQLRKVADLQIDISYSDIETARKIEGVLTPTQLKKWQDIQVLSLEKAKIANSKDTKATKK